MIKEKDKRVYLLLLIVYLLLLITPFNNLITFFTPYLFAQSSGGSIIEGNIPSETADSGNPVKIGGKFAIPVIGTLGNRGNLILNQNNNSLFTSLVDGSGTGILGFVGGNVDNDDATRNGIQTNSRIQEFNNTGWDRINNAFVQSTSGITTNTTGTIINMSSTPMSKFSLLITRTVGATDVVSINLEGCGDAACARPFTFASVTSVTGGNGAAFTGDKPVRFMRYNVVTVGAGNTLTIDLVATR